MSSQQQTSVDPHEVAKFELMAHEWWDPNGKFRPLHLMNPVRLDYINSQLEVEFDRRMDDPKPFSGLSILDIGCGGGLLTEPMSRLGAKVLGIDVSETNVAVAELHARQSQLSIEYATTSVEELSNSGTQFDAALCMEVIEHVANPGAFLAACRSLLKPGGVFVCSTLNRNPKSFLLAIVGAEYVMRWLPVGTHDWNKFIKPADLELMLHDAGFKPVDIKGFVFNPIRREWTISDYDQSVNYVSTSLAV